MNRKFLIMVATICGLVMVVSLLLFPMTTLTVGNESSSSRAIQAEVGGFLLLFTWLACGFAAFLFLGKTAVIGLGENTCRMLSLLGFKLAAFFFLALLIAGCDRGSWGVGFWLAFIASLVGAFAVYLTFNPDLAKKIADATKSDEAAPPSEPSAGA